jgi:hypothetical protein
MVMEFSGDVLLTSFTPFKPRKVSPFMDGFNAVTYLISAAVPNRFASGPVLQRGCIMLPI